MKELGEIDEVVMNGALNPLMIDMKNKPWVSAKAQGTNNQKRGSHAAGQEHQSHLMHRTPNEPNVPVDAHCTHPMYSSNVFIQCIHPTNTGMPYTTGAAPFRYRKIHDPLA